MANDTATLALKGKVSLRDYATAMRAFGDIIRALGQEVAQGTFVDWEVTGLEPGSAHTTVRGTPRKGTSAVVVERIVSAYENVGSAIRAGKPVPYSHRVRAPVNRLVGILNGDVRSVVFETESEDIEVFSPDVKVEEAKSPRLAQVSHGAVRGRVQSLSNRHELRFTLYDLIHDSPVNCYLSEGREDEMRQAWGRICIVEGVVRRDPFTGYPTAIRQVVRVKPIKETGGSWRDAVGAAKGRPGDTLPEEAIRRVRDA